MALWLWGGGGILFADVPNEIVYQGRLKEYGQPVSGSRSMVFEIYPAASGGIASWTSGAQSVNVSSGIFSYVLTPNVDWRGKDFWIQITVNSKELSPREKITAQVFALHSKTAENLSEDSGADISMSIGSQTKAVLKSDGEFKAFLGNTTYYMVPKGFIGIWSGTIANIPSGWALCDGTNGTPDLRDRFIVGAGSSYNVSDTGGAESVTLTAAQMPSHSHGFTMWTMSYTEGGSTNGFRLSGPSYALSTDATGGGGSHENRPPFYSLAYIMKQ
ncbi:MAG: hypothetical protein NT145_06725 [Elusimicrobia bacterium]|nr:hypothetical protein [Elusimicrobiota bacterium]